MVGTAGNSPPSLVFATYVTREVRGRWLPAVTLALPKDDLIGGATNALPNSVSCVDTSDCVVVGQFRSDRLTKATTLSFSVTESAGRWGQPIVLTDLFSHSAVLTGVSCLTKGECVAVGTVVLPSSFTGAPQPFSVLIEHDRWAHLRLLPLPTSAAPLFGGGLSGLWCSRTVSSCVAVGGVWTSANGQNASRADGIAPVAYTWHVNAWKGNVLSDTLDGAAGGAQLEAVSCAGVLRTCVATGIWTSSDDVMTVPISASI